MGQCTYIKLFPVSWNAWGTAREWPCLQALVPKDLTLTELRHFLCPKVGPVARSPGWPSPCGWRAGCVGYERVNGQLCFFLGGLK